MSNAEAIIALLGALYLSECWIWVRHGSVVFRAFRSGNYKVVGPSSVLGNHIGGLVFLNPLPPFGTSFICHRFPFSIDTAGTSSLAVQSLATTGREQQKGKYVSFAAIQGMWASGGTILINGQPFASFGESELATEYANLLVTIWKAPIDRRKTALDAMLSKLTDTRTLRERVDVYRRSSRQLRITCHAMFALLLVLPIASLWFPRMRGYWMEWGIVTICCLAAIAAYFYVAHKRLLPGATTQRWKALITMVLTPTASVRACDALSRYILTTYDPLAAAALLLGQDAFRRFARRVMLDLANPAIEVDPESSREMRQVEESFRMRLSQALEPLLATKGYSLDEVMRPPVPDNPACLSFCPRCDAQFTVAKGRCADCGGVALHPFQAVAT